MYRFGRLLGSVGHRVKIHKITPATGKERGDIELKDYVVLQKPRDLSDCLPPRPVAALPAQPGRRSDGAPEPDGALREETRTKIRHYRQLYINRPDPIAFMTLSVDTSG